MKATKATVAVYHSPRESIYYVAFPDAAAEDGKVCCVKYSMTSQFVSDPVEVRGEYLRPFLLSGNSAEMALYCFALAVEKGREHFALRSSPVMRRNRTGRLSVLHGFSHDGRPYARLIMGI